MYLQKIRLENFRLFEDCTFVFKDGFNIIIGNYMTGKTSILEGIMLGCRHYLSKMEANPSLSIQNKDIRLKNFGRSIEPQFEVRLEHHYKLFDAAVTWETVRKNTKNLTQKKDKEFTDICSKIKKKIQKNDFVILPLLAYYPAERPAKDESFVNVPLGSRLEGYKKAFEASKNYQEIQNWLITKQLKIDSKVNDYQKAALEFRLVKDVLLKTLDLKDIFFDIELQTAKTNSILHFEMSDGRILPLSALSSGYRIIFAIVGDLAVRCIRLNPHLGENAIADTPGVVLTDEIDQHLHPILQQKIVNILRTAFPKLQFIVTTHSPHIIASAHAGEIINLPDIQNFEDLNGLILRANQKSYQAWQTDFILREVMNSPLMQDQIIANFLEKINQAYQQKDLKEFDCIFEDLCKVLNPNDSLLKIYQIKRSNLL